MAIDVINPLATYNPSPTATQLATEAAATKSGGGGLGGGFWGSLVNNLTGNTDRQVTAIRTDTPVSGSQQQNNKILLIIAVILILGGIGVLAFFALKK